jgi:hypothetical protein
MTHWMPEVAIRVKAGFIQPIKAIPRIHPSFFAVSKFTIISLYTNRYGNLKHAFYANSKKIGENIRGFLTYTLYTPFSIKLPFFHQTVQKE